MNNQSISWGDFELTALSDGFYISDGGAFFGVVPKVLWERKVKPDEKNRIYAGLNSVLVRTGKQNILIETGIGNKLSAKMKQFYEPKEKLLENLHATGLAPDDIDIVINSHLHFDHCGWNTVYKGGRAVATFPKAKYFVQEGEWRHGQLQLERDRISYISDNYNPLISSGQMQLLNGPADIAPGISVAVYPGHTRNLQAVFIRSGGKTACYISDLIPTTWHLDITWVMAYDLFPLETIENRKKYYEQAISQNWLTIFTHDPDVPWSYLERVNDKVVLKP
ncbi:MAG: MBL fold metallo-hydrolase [Candidatus Angelobacter sp. Gp1-AA117]|nr:MAG: MBL fold metallo-hydrolase [Candidatus Angelobacter sp. Gp1-AA117]